MYLNEMSTISLKHGGTIDKFIGDAIVIFFGAPETNGEKEDALACVSMALEMRECLANMQKELYEQGIIEPFQNRMGITTGYCTVGNFGSDVKMDYTIIGGQVNLASRLESSAEVNQILIAHETSALIKDEICALSFQIVAKSSGQSHYDENPKGIQQYDPQMQSGVSASYTCNHNVVESTRVHSGDRA